MNIPSTGLLISRSKFLVLVFSLSLFVKLDAQEEKRVYTLSDTLQIERLLDENLLLQEKRNYEKALMKLDTAETICLATLGEKSKKNGRIWYNRASIYQEQFLLDTALVICTKAISIFTDAVGEVHYDVAAAYNLRGIIYYFKSEFSNAVADYEKSMDIQLKLPDPDLLQLARFGHNVGVCYRILGDFDNALKYFRKTLETEKQLGPDTANIAIPLTSIGITYQQIGDNDNALIYFQQALDIQLKYLDQPHAYVGDSYNNIGVCYDAKGDFIKSIEYYNLALSVKSQTIGLNHPSTAESYSNIGNSYDHLTNHKKAIENHKKALKIRIKTYGEAHYDVVNSYINLAASLSYNEDYSQAIDTLLKGESILKNIDLGSYFFGHIYNNLGMSYYGQRNYIKGIETHNKALEVWKNTYGDKHHEVVNSFYNIGGCYKELGDLTSAKNYYAKALIANNYINKNPQNVLSYELLLTTIKEIGFIHLSKANTKQAILDFEEALAILSNYRLTFLSSSSKQRLSSKFLPIYEGHIRANFDSYKNDTNSQAIHTAFLSAESAKAFSLYEGLKETGAQKYAGIPARDLIKEKQLLLKITSYEHKRAEEETKEDNEKQDSITLAYSHQIFKYRQSLDSLIQYFEKAHPQYKKMKYDLEVVNVPEIQDNLLEGTQTLVEYFVGDSSIFIFAIQKENYKLVEIKKDFPLNEWVSDMRRGIQSRGLKKFGRNLKDQQYLDSMALYYIPSAVNLYKKLIAPIEQFLTEDIIIIPDAELSYLPFEALLKNTPEDITSFRKYPYFINDLKAISYAQSATLLREMQNKKHAIEPLAYCLSNASFTDNPSLTEKGNSEETKKNDAFTPLIGSGIEVQSVAELTNGDAYFGAEATNSKFAEIAWKYRILHLSQHAEANQNVGDNSYIAFYGATKNGKSGKLYVRDIFNLQFNADIAMLSACETGHGELRRGEGIVGMVRAFTYAGAKSLFATLWKVDDFATKDLTVTFYKNLLDQKLKKSTRKDLALTNSKRNLIKNDKTAHPYFWAGMIGIGDMSPIPLPEKK